MERFKKNPHIVLTSHRHQMPKLQLPVHWGASDPHYRAPIIATFTDKTARNAIGAHSGSYSVYRALSIASGHYSQAHRADLSHTQFSIPIGPYPSWFDPDKIISLDPWGAINDYFSQEVQQGFDLYPTIAATHGKVWISEISQAIINQRIAIDHQIVMPTHEICITKIAIEPVWYLPGIAKRLNTTEAHLRKVLFEETGGMFPELVTRPDLKVLLPPIGGATAYVLGNPNDLAKPEIELTCRIHDECNGSDVFGSDICTCRPYLIHAFEAAVHTAQQGGVGLIVYFRKEGRALGEVTKFLVYNARKKQEGGDQASQYFYQTECVAGVSDARFQELMPDVLHWFGITKIDYLISMSEVKYRTICESGITVKERVTIPEHLIPEDAQVEIQAKKSAGYFSG
ncbi:MAG: GTP cyclohydrolase II [Proteobacteria bacterium]|nr:GTP cyclohydrolase II [Pseudomonadota bacterium]